MNGNTRPVDGDNMEHFKRKAKSTEQAISRLTLGEIGNRVSAITIDTSKGGAIKKEILQPADGILTRARSAKLAFPSSLVTVKQDGGHQHDTKVYSKATKAETVSEIYVEPLVVDKFLYLCSKIILLFSFKDLAPVKVEWMPDHNHLSNAPRVADVDIGLFEVMSHNSAPMDVSDDGTDAFSKAMFIEQIEDIDAEDSENPQLVSLYVNNIYTYMRQLEVIIFLIIIVTVFLFKILRVHYCNKEVNSRLTIPFNKVMGVGEHSKDVRGHHSSYGKIRFTRTCHISGYLLGFLKSSMLLCLTLYILLFNYVA